MAVNAPEPKVEPATDEKVFDKMWLQYLNVQAGTKDGNDVAILQATLRYYRVVNGKKELAPNGVSVKVDDLFALSENDPSMASLVDAVVAAVVVIAQAQNKL